MKFSVISSEEKHWPAVRLVDNRLEFGLAPIGVPIAGKGGKGAGKVIRSFIPVEEIIADRDPTSSFQKWGPKVLEIVQRHWPNALQGLIAPGGFSEPESIWIG
jgi:hypothetical protein